MRLSVLVVFCSLLLQEPVDPRYVGEIKMEEFTTAGAYFAEGLDVTTHKTATSDDAASDATTAGAAAASKTTITAKTTAPVAVPATGKTCTMEQLRVEWGFD